MRLFQKEMNILQEIYTCSSCGERGFKSQVFTELININHLEIFILPRDKVEIILSKPLCQQKAYQLYYNEKNNNYYYLLPHLISEKTNSNNESELFFPICMKCIKEMKNNKPGYKYSIAHNENYGRYSLCSKDGIDIKELTMVDKMAICPLRLLQTTLKLNNPIKKKETKNESSTYKIEGHCISFECEHLTLQEKNIIKIIEKDSVLDNNSKINLPNVDMNSRMQVIFTGSKGDYDIIRKDIAGLKSPVAINVQQCISFLKLAQSLNPFFELYVNVKESIKAAQELTDSVHNMHNNTVIDPRESTLKLSKKMCHDIARPGDQSALGHSFLVKRNLSNMKGDSGQRILSILEKSLIGINNMNQKDDINNENNVNITNDEDNDLNRQNDNKTTTESLRRDDDPICEFTDMSKIIHLSFPHLFQLGQGIPFKGTLPMDYIEHLFLQWDNRFGEDPHFVAVLFNMLQRHTVAKEIKGKVMNSKFTHNALTNEIFQNDFEKRIQKAKEEPDGEDANYLKNIFQKIIKMGTSNVPFSPGERTSVQPTMYSYAYFFGYSNIFNTVAPDSFFSPLLLRTLLSDCKSENYNLQSCDTNLEIMNSFIESLKTFPENQKEFDPYIEVPRNPARTAMFVNKFMNATGSILYGLNYTHNIKKTKSIEDRNSGVFGKMLCNFGVYEVKIFYFS